MLDVIPPAAEPTGGRKVCVCGVVRHVSHNVPTPEVLIRFYICISPFRGKQRPRTQLQMQAVSFTSRLCAPAVSICVGMPKFPISVGSLICPHGVCMCDQARRLSGPRTDAARSSRPSTLNNNRSQKRSSADRFGGQLSHNSCCGRNTLAGQAQGRPRGVYAPQGGAAVPALQLPPSGPPPGAAAAAAARDGSARGEGAR